MTKIEVSSYNYISYQRDHSDQNDQTVIPHDIR